MAAIPLARRIAEHSFIPAWLDAGSTVVDLGMNRGRFADAIHARFGCRVVGVEPDPELAAANAARGIACRHAAIAPEPGSVRFRVDATDRTASRIVDGGATKGGGGAEAGLHDVPALPLHRFLAESGVTQVQLLKMDIEGAELAVFEREPPGVLERCEQITVEFHAFLDPAQRPRVLAILREMERRGFHWVDFSLCLMDVLLVNTRRRPLSAVARQALVAAKWVHGARRRLGVDAEPCAAFLARESADADALAPVRARAPLRVGLAGGGTDLSPFADTHGGFVLNATVSLYAYAHIAPRRDGRVVFEAAETGERFEGEAVPEVPIGPEALLHRGVYNAVVRRFRGGRPLPVTVRTTVDVPAGSGMGGSSALVVALVEGFREYLGLSLGEYDLARLAFEIERHDLGLAGGRQDQYAAAFGGFNFMEFHAGERVIVNPLRVRPAVAKELEASLVLYYTGRSRSSARIIEGQQANMRAAGPGGGRTMEALLQLKQEAVDMKEAVLTGDLRRAARTLARGWEAKKATAEGVSSSEIDRVLELVLEAGALAGKVSGAGGGGFLMVMADPFERQRVLDALAREPGRVLPCVFAPDGAEAWRARL